MSDTIHPSIPGPMLKQTSRFLEVFWSVVRLLLFYFGKLGVAVLLLFCFGEHEPGLLNLGYDTIGIRRQWHIYLIYVTIPMQLAYNTLQVNLK